MSGPSPSSRAKLARGADGKNSNLPEPMTSFVGRERELVEIKRLLPHARLLTLTGVGGIGKTRLALQVGAEVLGAYRHAGTGAGAGARQDPDRTAVDLCAG